MKTRELTNKYFFLFFYICLFAVWIAIYRSYFSFDEFSKHFIIPVIMVFGSFIAGATSEGGGAIAFPVFSKVLHIDPATARNFSLAIQSIGMTSASLMILVRRIPIDKRMLIYGTVIGIASFTASTVYLVPFISAGLSKLIFTLVVTSFGIALFLKNFVFKCKGIDVIPRLQANDIILMAIFCIFGGIFTSIAGTGLDIITFSFVTLYFKLNEKIATPTSVVMMAICSIYGYLFHLFGMRDFRHEEFVYWMLCIPVVALFAPIGAIFCAKTSRNTIVLFLLFLIFLEFISTLFILQMTNVMMAITVVIIPSVTVFYTLLIWFPKKVAAEKVAGEFPHCSP